ncbi:MULTISPECIES: protein-tyrosine phosphatase family protein [Salinibaculum]|uniref:protein-tyrosine phosphatase family protein n=1 Tax=Salinibaculum TaxID=2732368 RepID=UPI0030D32E12
MTNLAPVENDAHRFAPAGPDEDIVYGACCPGWHTAASHEAAVAQWVSFMRDHGIERVCCLLPGDQLDAGGANVARYNEAFGPDQVLHAPIPDHRLADPDVLREDIHPFLDEADADREPVVVHCLTGLGRTGQVLAAWLVHARQCSPEVAVETVQSMGRDPLAVVEAGNATREELLTLLALTA